METNDELDPNTKRKKKSIYKRQKNEKSKTYAKNKKETKIMNYFLINSK